MMARLFHIGGSEEHLVANVIEEDGEKILHGYTLSEKRREATYIISMYQKEEAITPFAMKYF